MLYLRPVCIGPIHEQRMHRDEEHGLLGVLQPELRPKQLPHRKLLGDHEWLPMPHVLKHQLPGPSSPIRGVLWHYQRLSVLNLRWRL